VKDKRVLIDTSVWIAYFRNDDAGLCQRVADLLSSVEVCVPKVVIAELMQGARTEKELAALEEFAEAFTIIDQTEMSWLQAGRLAYSLKRKGSAVNPVDCYIAVLAKENRCNILSLDVHFKQIQRVFPIELL